MHKGTSEIQKEIIARVINERHI
ncbi:hypothetical protein [Natronorarus salvus]